MMLSGISAASLPNFTSNTAINFSVHKTQVQCPLCLEVFGGDVFDSHVNSCSLAHPTRKSHQQYLNSYSNLNGALRPTAASPASPPNSTSIPSLLPQKSSSGSNSSVTSHLSPNQGSSLSHSHSPFHSHSPSPSYSQSSPQTHTSSPSLKPTSNLSTNSPGSSRSKKRGHTSLPPSTSTSIFTSASVSSPHISSSNSASFFSTSFPKKPNEVEDLPKLVEAPIFRPTEEQFKDPMKYISSIREEVKKYGICKIIPPSNKWLGGKPFPKVVNPNTFIFQTKLQNIHLLQRRSGGNAKFAEDFEEFSRIRGTRSFSNVATASVDIGGHSVEVYRLYHAIVCRGGLRTVSHHNLWKDVAFELNLHPSPFQTQGSAQAPDAKIISQLRLIYKQILYPFELYQRKKLRLNTPQVNISKPKDKDRQHTDGDPDADPVEDGIEDYDLEELDHGMKSTSSGLQEDDPEEFGYEDGKMFTLNSYKKMANNFKKNFIMNHYKLFTKNPTNTASISVSRSKFAKMPAPVSPTEIDIDKVSYADIERVYWHIVDSCNEQVQVHYGSDLDIGTHGSGFPNSPTDLSACSGWNLNVFAKQPGSLLRFLNESIQGVTQPMMYIGMLFSTFCWHTEDNYLYSINYLHHGAPKTWYGIPAGSAEDFEKVMRNTVPELFEANKELLFLLITMLHPKILVKSNIPVCHALQQCGEFIITLPKAYHAGFSHGFNCAESTNFALYDWIPFGRECIERYRQYSRSSVFSLEKLLVNASLLITSTSSSNTSKIINTSDNSELLQRLQYEVPLLRSTEEYLREKVTLKEGTWKATHFANFNSHDVIQECHHCKYDCYLSAIVCPCSPDKVVCLRHSDKICKCDPSRRILLFRWTLEDIDEIIKRLGIGKPVSSSEPSSVKPMDITLPDAPMHSFDVALNEYGDVQVIGNGRIGCKRNGSDRYNSSFPFLLAKGSIHKKAVRKLARCTRAVRIANHGNVNSAVNRDLEDEKCSMFTMSKILDQRMQNGHLDYLIKWEGFSASESTWEKGEDLRCCKAMIEAFQNKNATDNTNCEEKKSLLEQFISSGAVSKNKRGRMMSSV